MLQKTFSVQTTSKCSVFWECKYSDVENLVGSRNVVLISDTTVYCKFSYLFKQHKCIILETGERIKSFETVQFIISKLIEYKTDRNSIIIGIGGGTICDLTGFVASILMRGISFGFVPTTLLAQVDAAIGGKNAINYNNFKNLIGTINQPEFIICNSMFLQSLPPTLLKSGMGEIIKYSLISNLGIFDDLSNNYKNLQFFDEKIFVDIIKKCIEFKISIIEQDVLDKNIRHLLNFGHTFAHCFELIDKIPHGIAVVKGMLVAIDLSVKKGILNQKTSNKIKKLFLNLGFDINYKIYDKHLNLLFADKKKNTEFIDFVYLKNIGTPIIIKTPIEELRM